MCATDSLPTTSDDNEGVRRMQSDGVEEQTESVSTCEMCCQVRRVVLGGFSRSVFLRTFSDISRQNGIDAFVISCVETFSHGLGECK